MGRSLLVCVVLFLTISSLSSQVPKRISYQGLLTTAAGTPLPDGLYDLQFDMFTDSVGGSTFWTEVDTNVTVLKGTFNIILGGAATLPDSFHRPLYVEVTATSGPGIGSPVTFTPRSALLSSPYALSLKMPFTGRAALPSWGTVFSIYNDAPGGLAILGRSQSPGFSNIGAVNGVSDGFQANGIYGVANNGNQAWGVYGATDSGAGAAGYAFRRNGIGIAGYNNYYGQGIGVYSYGKLRVDAYPGDTSVILPASSISSSEIADEVGVSQALILSGGVTVPTSGGFVTIDSTTISLPADGYVVLEASGQAAFAGTTGVNIMSIQLDDELAPAFDYNHYFYAGFDSYSTTGYHFLPIGMRKTYFKSKGTYTFRFHAANGGSSSGAFRYIWNPVITATYIPTSYGTVQEGIEASISPTAGRQSASKSYTPGNQLQTAGARVTPTDLRELEIRALRAREEAERATQQYLDARNEKARELKRTNDRPGGDQ